MKSLIALLIVLPFTFAFAADENCTSHTVSCELKDQALSTLKLKQQEMKNYYGSPEDNKGLGPFEKDIQSYLSIHNQLINCPGFKENCPQFSSKQYLSDKKGIMVTRDLESFGSPCVLRKPSVSYDSKDKELAHQIGANISISIQSKCQPNLFMSFTAYKEGLLVMAGREEGGRFNSNEVARRILLNSTEVSTEATDEKTFRINWKVKDKTQWIDIDTETMTFKASNFMKVDQINSGSCQVEKLDQPKAICEKNRKDLIKYKSIKSPDEYECYEYVPVINGVSNRISRG